MKPFSIAAAAVVVAIALLNLGFARADDRADQLTEAQQRELEEVERLTPEYLRLYEKGKYADAAALAERQLEVRTRLLGEESPDTILSAIRLASCLKSQGSYAPADSLYRKALATSRDVLGEPHAHVALILNDLGEVSYAQGNLIDAEELYNESLAMRRSLFGESHLDVAQTLNGLAVVHWMKGDFAGAEALYREALAIRRELLGEEDAVVAETQNDYATLLYTQGDYAAAEPLFRQALATFRKDLGDEHPSVATLLNNHAMVLKTQGDYVEAERRYREALVVYRGAYGEEHPDIARCLNNLGMLYQAQEDYAAAEPLLREALAMWRDLLDEEHRDVAAGLQNLSIALREQGKYDEAEPLIIEALAIQRKTRGDEHRTTAKYINELAKLSYARGDYAAAEPLFREALEINRKVLGEENRDVVGSLYNLALLLVAQDRFEEAEALLTQAGDVYDAARIRAGGGLARVAFRRSPYPTLAAARLELAMTDSAWPAAEKDLGRALIDLLVTADQRSLSEVEATEQASLKKNLSACERKLAAYRRAALKDGGGEAAAKIEEAQKNLFGAEAEWSAFQAEISGKYPVTEGQAYSLDRVQSALDEQTAIIGWLDVEEGKDSYGSWAYVIRDEGPVVWSRLDRASREGEPSPFERVRMFREELLWPTADPSEITRWAMGVYSERVAPVAEALKGIEHLVVVPSGAMLSVPVEALVDGSGGFVGERFVVSYIPSATVFVWLHEQSTDRRAAGGGTLLVGDPPFSEYHVLAMQNEELAAAEAPSESRPDAAALRSVLSGNEEALAALPRLPASRDEVTAISTVARSPSLLLGLDASEQNISRLAESGSLLDYSVIHLATHAFVDDERPERSALVLSQVGLPDPLESAMSGTRIFDGLVSAEEIVREWELEADLVTLSACETALGRVVGGEGYVGFSHAFFQAGARSVLVSLWEVEDRATSLLMTRYYENYFGAYGDTRIGKVGTPLTKAEALREAKQWLRNYTDGSGYKPFAHPYYWSAFILIGDRGDPVG